MKRKLPIQRMYPCERCNRGICLDYPSSYTRDLDSNSMYVYTCKKCMDAPNIYRRLNELEEKVAALEEWRGR